MLFFILFTYCFAAEYCYEKIESSGALLGYVETPKGTNGCGNLLTQKPELKGDYICVETGKLCGEGADNKVTETKCYLVDKCIPYGTTQKFTVSDNTITIMPYTSQTCDDSSKVTSEKETFKCDECNEKGDADDRYKCHVKSGAIETAILLVVAFIFFLF